MAILVLNHFLVKNFYLHSFLLVLIASAVFSFSKNIEHKTLEIGAAAPDFSLQGVDGKTYSLSSFKNAEILVVIFTCNHCPTAQAYEERIMKLTTDYAGKNVQVVCIMPNDPASLRLDELDFSDLGDSFDEMKIRAAERKFNFPYLYDGSSQKVSLAYGPVATPHAFIFDRERRLRYQGRIDDTENPFKSPRTTDTRNAINALLQHKAVPVPTTKVFGCSIKWSEKKESVEKALIAWSKEPVNLTMIDNPTLKNLLTNSSKKLYLINFWSTSSTVSMDEFSSFITINRMYRNRDFEFISICADEMANKDSAFQFLTHQQASNTNYFLDVKANPDWTNLLNPSWKGTLPYTFIVEPGGKIVYSRLGAINDAELKSTIVSNPMIGRYP